MTADPTPDISPAGEPVSDSVAMDILMAVTFLIEDDPAAALKLPEGLALHTMATAKPSVFAVASTPNKFVVLAIAQVAPAAPPGAEEPEASKHDVRIDVAIFPDGELGIEKVSVDPPFPISSRLSAA